MTFFISLNTLSANNGRLESSNLYNTVINLKTDKKKGAQVFFLCSTCHQQAEQTRAGSPFQPPLLYPQLAGQHKNVIIKQMTEFLTINNRNIPPHIVNIHLIHPQDIADISEYAASIFPAINSMGNGNDLELGKDLYRVHCTKCHGRNAQGDNEEVIPRIQGQNYHYMLGQFIKIRDGLSIHGEQRMKLQISRFTFREMMAVIDYVSRLKLITQDQTAKE